MCGRYRTKDPKRILDWLEVEDSIGFRPRFNVAPTQRVPVVTAERKLQEMSWGIIPKWADVKSRALINARCESVREKRSFKHTFIERRCLGAGRWILRMDEGGKAPPLVHFEWRRSVACELRKAKTSTLQLENWRSLPEPL